MVAAVSESYSHAITNSINKLEFGSEIPFQKVTTFEGLFQDKSLFAVTFISQ